MTVGSSPRGKLFGIGMFRTGTTSLGRAMEILGFCSRHHLWRLLPLLEHYFDPELCRHEPHLQAIRAEAELYDFMADASWLYLFRELDAWFPDSRFILSLRRDTDTLVANEMRMWKQMGLLEKWVRRNGSPPPARLFVQRSLKHRDAVLEHFRDRPDDLLTLCLETETDPWSRLCAFVGRPVPDEPFPHLNRTR